MNDLLNKNVEDAVDYERSLLDTVIAGSSHQFVIFGAGNLGRKIAKGLQELGLKLLGFSDNNPALWNSHVEELRVFPPVDAIKLWGNKAVFLISIWTPGDNYRNFYIQQQLKDSGCSYVVDFTTLFWKYPDIFLPYFHFDLPHKIYLNKDKLLASFKLFNDEISQQVFWEELLLLLRRDPGFISCISGDPVSSEIFIPMEDEVLVDCGAFDGDSLQSFLCTRKAEFKHIISIEPDPNSFVKLSQYASILNSTIRDNITLFNCAIGSLKRTVRFRQLGCSSNIAANGEIEIPCERLDELVADWAPTFIKMDIEGSEAEALRGAASTIVHCNPVLAVCVYHLQHDLWNLPLTIKAINPKYRFFLRRFSKDFDTVLFAVPVDRMKNGHY